jgi:peptidyl-prolyl cis-trans isomerase C
MMPLAVGRAGEQVRSPGAAVAVVNGTTITRATLDREIALFQQRLASLGQTIEDPESVTFSEKVLEIVINRELLYQESQRQGITIDQASIDEWVAQVKRQFPSQETYERALTESQMSEGDLENQIRRQMSVEKLIDRDIAEHVAVPEEETRAFFDNNQKLFPQPEKVRASHILVKVDAQADEDQKAAARKKLEQIRDKLSEGDDFAALAKTSSDCPSSAKGGDLGYFERGKMVKPFEDAVFALKLGEISDVVETRFGYHLIKLTDREAAGVRPYEAVKEDIAQHLKNKKVQHDLQAYLQDLRKDAEIERMLNPET